MINYIFSVYECYLPMWSNYLVYIVGLALVVFIVRFISYMINRGYNNV